MQKQIHTKIIGVFGGTFDPIHNAHLYVAQNILQHFDCQQIHFIPCKKPLLKAPATANTKHRLNMLQKALKGYPNILLDERELLRSKPSYMYDTLQSLQQDFPKIPLALIVGMDAFLQLPQWYRWQELLSLAHIIVVNRKQLSLPQEGKLFEYLQHHQTTQKTDLYQISPGKIYLHQIPEQDISSNLIRENINTHVQQVPSPAQNYIKQHHLYKK